MDSMRRRSGVRETRIKPGMRGQTPVEMPITVARIFNWIGRVGTLCHWRSWHNVQEGLWPLSLLLDCRRFRP